MELAPGTFVTENVRLIEPLGAGGMGSVWKAKHISLDMRVAVKFILSELVEDNPDILARFGREAKAAAQIRSPHVVQVLDYGIIEDETPYIVMELLEGNSLAEWLALGEVLSVRDTARMVSQVASVLDKAHQLGIVHRDIKPDNIFLVDSEDDLFVKVLDFGIAKQTSLPGASPLTGSGVMVGTPHYMSPELLVNPKDVTEQADLWALAVVAYQALTGVLPFDGATLGALVLAISNAKAPPPSGRLESVPKSLDRFFEKALHKDPSRRFPSAKKLAEELAKAAGTSGRRVSRPHSRRYSKPEAPADDRDRPRAQPARSRRTSGEQPARSRRTSGEQPVRQPAQPAEQAVAKPPRAVDSVATAPTEIVSLGEEPVRRSSLQPEPAEQGGLSRRATPRAEPIDLAPTSARRGKLVSHVRQSPQQRAALKPLGSLLQAALLVVLVTGVVQLVEPFGRQAVEERFGAGSYIPYGIAAVITLLAGAKVWDKGRGYSSFNLWLAGVGLFVLGGCLGATALDLALPTFGLHHYRATLLQATAVAAAVVPLGLSLFGIMRARQELLEREEREITYGAILLVLSLVGLGATYQLSRRPLRTLLGAAVPSRPEPVRTGHGVTGAASPPDALRSRGFVARLLRRTK